MNAALMSSPGRVVAVWGTYPFKHSRRLHDLACSPDGRSLWAVDDRSVTLWDPVRGALVWSFPLAPPDVVPTTCALSPDGRLLLVGRADGSLDAYDLASGERRWTARATEIGRGIVPSLSRITFAPTTPLAATFSADEGERVTRIWNTSTGQLVQTYARSWPLFSPDGRHLLCGGAALLDARTGAVVREFEGEPTSAAAFSGDGRLLLVGRDDGELHLWDVGSGERRWAAQLPGQHGGKPPALKHVAVSPDGLWGHALSASELSRWVLSDGRLWGRSGFGGTWRASFAPDGSRVFGVGLHRQRIRHYDATYQAEIRSPYEHEESIVSVHATDALVITTGAEGTARVWTRDGYHARVFSVLDARDASLSPDGRHALLLDSMGAHIRDVTTGETRATLGIYQSKIPRTLRGGRFTRDGAAALLWDEDQTLLCWEPAADRERWRLRCSARFVELDPDGERAWISAPNSTIEVRKISTGELLATHPVGDHLRTHRHVPLLDGAATLGVVTEQGLAARKLGGLPAVFAGSERVIELLAVSADRALAVGREDGAISLWDVAGQSMLDRVDLAASADQATCAAFTPDGQTALVGTSRGVVWQLAPRG